MSCTDCESWNLKSAGAMARQGFGHCANRPKWEFVARGCAQIKPAAAAVIAARLAWLNKYQGSK